MKADKENCSNELKIARDSISYQSTIIDNQELKIGNLVEQTEIYKANEANYEEIILNKDSIIIEKKKQVKKYKKNTQVAYAITVLNCIVFILALI
jgi:hypothetical protein